MTTLAELRCCVLPLCNPKEIDKSLLSIGLSGAWFLQPHCLCVGAVPENQAALLGLYLYRFGKFLDFMVHVAFVHVFRSFPQTRVVR
jgi:hypothetical protein